jgi:hypothetical protein
MAGHPALMPDCSGGCGCVVRILEARLRPLTFHAMRHSPHEDQHKRLSPDLKNQTFST